MRLSLQNHKAPISLFRLAFHYEKGKDLSLKGFTSFRGSLFRALLFAELFIPDTNQCETSPDQNGRLAQGNRNLWPQCLALPVPLSNSVLQVAVSALWLFYC